MCMHTVAADNPEYEDIRLYSEIATEDTRFDVTACPAYSVAIAQTSLPSADQEYEQIDQVQGSSAASEQVTMAMEGGEGMIPEVSAASEEEQADNSSPTREEHVSMDPTQPL